jgi:hypothetical protein
MAEFRLEDLWAIIQGLIIVGVGLFVLYAIWALAPQISALTRAFWARHFNRSWWEDLLIWLADQGGGVNDYAYPPAYDMSSEAGWEDDDRPVAPMLQQNNNAATMDCNALPENNALLLQRDAAMVAKFVRAGVVGETKGLQIGFGVKPSSTSTKYQEARDALKVELAKLDPPARTTPIAGRRTRAAFHGDENGA